MIPMNEGIYLRSFLEFCNLEGGLREKGLDPQQAVNDFMEFHHIYYEPVVFTRRSPPAASITSFNAAMLEEIQNKNDPFSFHSTGFDFLKRRHMPKINEKIHVGDGVYAWFDGYQIWVTLDPTANAFQAIALDDRVLTELGRLRESFIEKEDDSAKP